VRARDAIDRFDLLDPLAASGLGVIIRALDRETGEEVALKLFHPPHGTSAEELGSFVAAMRELITLDHPQILRVFAAGLEEGVPFVAREWLAGGSLAELLWDRKRLPEREVLAIGLQVADALSAAEAMGVRHRDIEPGNLIFADSSTIKVADFGQAAFFDRASAQTGTVWGSLPYVAPERLCGEPEDARSDIYALGATLFHALTGEPPFGGETQGEPFAERLAHEATRVDRAALVVHPATAGALEIMLALDPAKRPRNWRQAHELLHRAERAVPRPLAAPPRRAETPATRSAAERPERSRSRATALVVGLLAFAAAAAAWQTMKPFKPAGRTKRQPHATLSAPAPDPAAPALITIAPARTTLAALAPVASASPAAPPAPPSFDFTGWTTAKLDPASTPDPVAGEASISTDGTALRLTGSNDGVGGNRDAVVFHHRQFTGNWTLTTRVVEVNGGVAGLMVRHDLQLSQSCLAVGLGEDGAVITNTRVEPDMPATRGPVVAGGKPWWLKLTRRGALFTAEHSSDGKTWLPTGSLATANSPASVPVGFITHALVKTGTATAEFDQPTFHADP